MTFENSFTHNHNVYDLTLVYKLVRKENIFLLNIKELLWVLDYDTPSEDRVLRSKHRYPLLVVNDHGRWTVVDGLHRLEKYRRKGITMIPVKLVSDDVLKRALIQNRNTKIT